MKFLGNFTAGFFWRNYLEEFFERNFFGGFFWEDFFGGFFWRIIGSFFLHWNRLVCQDFGFCQDFGVMTEGRK